MLDIDLEDALVKKVGGKFKLTTLIQKRMVELNRGARPLVKSRDGFSLRRLVCEEILLDKIQLASRDEVGYTFEEERIRIRTTGENQGEGERSIEEKEIFGSQIKQIKEQKILELTKLLNTPKGPEA